MEKTAEHFSLMIQYSGLERVKKGNVMFCTNCSNELDDDAIVCTKCGTDLYEERNFCNNCGVSITDKQVVCSRCGMDLYDFCSKCGILILDKQTACPKCGASIIPQKEEPPEIPKEKKNIYRKVLPMIKKQNIYCQILIIIFLILIFVGVIIFLISFFPIISFFIVAFILHIILNKIGYYDCKSSTTQKEGSSDTVKLLAAYLIGNYMGKKK